MDEQVAGTEADGAGEEEESECHQRHVAEEQEARNQLDDLQLGEEIKDGIEIQVQGRRARRKESAPPPVIVLGDSREGCADIVKHGKESQPQKKKKKKKKNNKKKKKKKKKKTAWYIPRRKAGSST